MLMSDENCQLWSFNGLWILDYGGVAADASCLDHDVDDDAILWPPQIEIKSMKTIPEFLGLRNYLKDPEQMLVGETKYCRLISHFIVSHFYVVFLYFYVVFLLCMLYFNISEVIYCGK